MKQLIEIQSELKAPKNQFNAFGKYNYRSCEDILEALKPLLKKHNCQLVVSDEIKAVGSFVFVEATATIQHEDVLVYSRAQAGIDPNRKGMDIAQSCGSSSSYARKYALNGLFLIDDVKDPDHGEGKNKKENAPPQNQQSKVTTWLTEEQFNKAMQAPANQIHATLAKYNNASEFGMKKEYREQLQSKIK